MLRIGYDGQAFLSSNGELGKGRQLRNLLGRNIDKFAGFATPAPNRSGIELIQEGVSRHRIWQQVSLPRSCRRTKSTVVRQIRRRSSCRRRCGSSSFSTTRLCCKASSSAISNPG